VYFCAALLLTLTLLMHALKRGSLRHDMLLFLYSLTPPSASRGAHQSMSLNTQYL
jgi:hypothetical protein